jgi:hypothetical protein
LVIGHRLGDSIAKLGDVDEGAAQQAVPGHGADDGRSMATLNICNHQAL